MSRKYLFLSVLFISIPAFAGDAPGIKNFDQVDQHVYRGGQPTSEGFQQLVKLGVKTVIDLREAGERATAEARTVSGAGMTYINIPMSGLTPPSEAEITKILNILEDVTSGPVFVHCMRGADRTGTVIAAYHINHDHWGNEQALKDAKKHGMSRFQFPRMSYIRSFRPRAINAKAANPGGAGSGAAEPAAASAPTPVAATVKN